MVGSSAVEIFERSFASAEKDRHDHEMEIVNQSRPEVLTQGRRAPAQPDVGTRGGVEPSLECRFDSVRDEVEGRATPSQGAASGIG